MLRQKILEVVFMNFLNKKGNSIIIVVIVALVVSLGVFAFLQFNTSPAFVVNGIIQSGEKISEDMLSDGTITMTQVPKTLANEFLITDFDEINGMFVRAPLKPGKLIFSYDIASSGDLRNNEILTTYDLEAITLTATQITGLSDITNKGDKVNVYGTYDYDMTSYKEAFGGQGYPVSALVKELQDVFIANGYKPTDVITAEEISVTKLLLQNVPVAEVQRDEYDIIQKVTLGVEPEHAEAIYSTLHSTGTVGLTVLPYNDGNYVEKETKGTVSSLELKNKGTINDVNPTE